MRRLLVLFVALSLPGPAIEPGESDWTPPRLSVTAKAPVFQSRKDIWLQVTLDNSCRGCRPIMITDTYFAFEENRPLTLLTFEIKDEKGNEILRAPQMGGTRPRYAVKDLLTLHCGASYGMYVVLGRPEWNYQIAAGLYTLRARVENRVRSFFERNPKELRRLSDAALLNLEETKALLTDFVVESGEITIQVKGE